MPAYKKKITRQMTYEEFEQGIQDLKQDRQAFLNLLFFSGCRISEALALTANDISCTNETVFVQFFRLKGSTQTDPLPLPRNTYLNWLCYQTGDLFSWCRTTGYNIVKRAFPELYPHYFRMNRFTDIAEKFPLATVVSFSGLNPITVKHYLAKVDIKKVGKALKEEVS